MTWKPYTTNFKLSKLKEFADDNFKLDKYARKFSKRIETLWEKEKMLLMKNFFFSPQCFQKACAAKTYTEPKKELSRDLNGTISTFAFINSFYSYLLLHNE